MKSLLISTLVIAVITLSSCVHQYPRFVNAKGSKLLEQIPKAKDKPATEKILAAANVSQIDSISGLSNGERKSSLTEVATTHHRSSQNVKAAKAPANSYSTKSTSQEINNTVNEPNSNRSNHRVWLMIVALIIPVTIVPGRRMHMNWIKRLLRRENFLRLLIAFHVFRSIGGFRTAMKVISGSLPGFAMIPALADLTIGAAALVLLVLSSNGGLKEMRGILLGWNTIGLVDFAVAITLFLAHGMMPSIPIYIPIFFIITHVLIYLMLRRKNFDELH